MRRVLIVVLVIIGLILAGAGGYFLAISMGADSFMKYVQKNSGDEENALRNAELETELAELAKAKTKLDEEILAKEKKIKEDEKLIDRLEKKNSSFLEGYPLVDLGISKVEIIAEETTSGGGISGPFAVKVTLSNLTDKPLENVRVLVTLNASSPMYPKSLPISTRRQKVIPELPSDGTADVVLIGFSTLYPEIQHDLTIEAYSPLEEENQLDNSKVMRLQVAPPSEAGDEQ